MTNPATNHTHQPDDTPDDWWRADAAGNYTEALRMIRERKQQERERKGT